MKGKVFMTVLAIVGVLATGCGGKTVGYVEEFKEKTQVPADWHPNGSVYMREDKEMGLVLCFGGTGEMLPKGVDSITTFLEVPSEGAIIEFEYKVYAAAGDLAYFLVRPVSGARAWMVREEATDWETASFVVSDRTSSYSLSRPREHRRVVRVVLFASTTSAFARLPLGNINPHHTHRVVRLKTSQVEIEPSSLLSSSHGL